eukprot:CAMPEP_0182868460 /NCGR_PEP_ID=MMETSP0034_2-20130328/9334_1 /TAXON_ID=156128 /ORGANISM="Nephroselmis pyriformis, Strain CCMP717" /LENGTH=289 /DNA_ID=CAMNT_0025000871 /DNA_START=124 /DNA_END=990 /DNA_ORIENTATION=+
MGGLPDGGLRLPSILSRGRGHSGAAPGPLSARDELPPSGGGFSGNSRAPIAGGGFVGDVRARRANSITGPRFKLSSPLPPEDAVEDNGQLSIGSGGERPRVGSCQSLSERRGGVRRRQSGGAARAVPPVPLPSFAAAARGGADGDGGGCPVPGGFMAVRRKPNFSGVPSIWPSASFNAGMGGDGPSLTPSPPSARGHGREGLQRVDSKKTPRGRASKPAYMAGTASSSSKKLGSVSRGADPALSPRPATWMHAAAVTPRPHWAGPAPLSARTPSGKAPALWQGGEWGPE